MSRLALVPLNAPSLSSAPTIPTLRAGDVYYNTSLGLQVYNGTAWVTVGANITVTSLDGGVSDSIAPYAGGKANATATQTINGGTA